MRICEYLLTSTNVVAWPLLALKIRFELVVLHSALFVALHSVLFVALHSALFGSLLAYEYKSTCLLVQKYLLASTERAAFSYKTRSMLDEMVV